MSNKFEARIPEKLFDIVTIRGYNFFRGTGNIFQCATCLSIMGVQADEDFPLAYKAHRVRKIKIVKDCDCSKQIVDDNQN